MLDQCGQRIGVRPARAHARFQARDGGDQTSAHDRFQQVGQLIRVETESLVVGYTFDLRTNELSAEKISNPTAGTSHRFRAFRLVSQTSRSVSMVVNPDEGLALSEDEE